MGADAGQVNLKSQTRPPFRLHPDRQLAREALPSAIRRRPVPACRRRLPYDQRAGLEVRSNFPDFRDRDDDVGGAPGVELGLETASLMFLMRCAPQAGPANRSGRRHNIESKLCAWSIVLPEK